MALQLKSYEYRWIHKIKTPIQGTLMVFHVNPSTDEEINLNSDV